MTVGSLGFGAGLSRVDPCSPRGLTLCCSLLCCTSPPSMCTHGLRSCRGPCCCLGLPPDISAETWFLHLCCCCCCYSSVVLLLLIISLEEPISSILLSPRRGRKNSLIFFFFMEGRDPLPFRLSFPWVDNEDAFLLRPSLTHPDPWTTAPTSLGGARCFQKIE